MQVSARTPSVRGNGQPLCGAPPWGRSCDVVGRRGLRDDPRFAAAPDRVKHRDVLVPIIVELTASRTVAEWMDVLGRAGVPYGRIRNVAGVCTNPQLTTRGKVGRVAGLHSWMRQPPPPHGRHALSGRAASPFGSRRRGG